MVESSLFKLSIDNFPPGTCLKRSTVSILGISYNSRLESNVYERTVALDSDRDQTVEIQTSLMAFGY